MEVKRSSVGTVPVAYIHVPVPYNLIPSLPVHSEILRQWGLAVSLHNVGVVPVPYDLSPLPVHGEVLRQQGLAVSLDNVGVVLLEKAVHLLNLPQHQSNMFTFPPHKKIIGIKQSITKILVQYRVH